ncbi:MAG: nucleotidyltransferase domain-containing protein [Fibrobacter sp.]|nr:nucleotidyltransferase domain-containing protein [Fibrobacter sp.]
MNFGLSDSCLNQIVSVFKKFPQIEKVIVFGSRVKGSYKNGSDIDLALTGSIDLETLTKIDCKLDDLLLPYTFDIVAVDKIDNPDLVDHINRVGIILYKKK